MWYTGTHSKWRRFRNLLRGRDVQELKELQRQGMSIQAISKLTGWDRKTIRKYMQAAGLAPEYGPRSVPPSKLDAYKPYLEERLRAGVWNARVLLRELRERIVSVQHLLGHSKITMTARYAHSLADAKIAADSMLDSVGVRSLLDSNRPPAPISPEPKASLS